MTKLHYSPKGAMRSLEMTSIDVIAVCEGVDHDTYFYGELMKSALEPKGIKYAVRKIEELNNGTGGKNAIYDFHKSLKKEEKLKYTSKNGKKIYIFFVDKDSDCVVSEFKNLFYNINSDENNVIYTKYYNVESHLYYDSDLVKSISICIGGGVAENILDQKAFCKKISLIWREWIILCLLSQVIGINCKCGYSLPSQINGESCLDNANYQEYHKFINSLADKAKTQKSVASEYFRSVENRLISKVDDLLRQESLFSIVNGKWIKKALTNYVIQQIPNLSKAKIGDIEKSIEKVALSNLVFSDDWSIHYTDKINRALD